MNCSEDVLKVFTVCSGYDSQCLALDRLGVRYDLVGWSEIDPSAIKAHNNLYPEYSSRNYGDLSKIDWKEVPDFDLFTYSTPCTDISEAGRAKGLEENSGTRSSLLWSCRNAIIEKRPKYLLMENVYTIASNKFMPYLQKWIDEVAGYGYHNYIQVLDAADYGIPQHRKRFFMVSVLGEEKYTFPKPVALRVKLKDMLENEVEDKFYMSDEQTDKYIKQTDKYIKFKL